MRRHLARLAAALLAVAAVALGGMWVRSYWRLDALSDVREDGTTRAIVSHRGAIHLIDARGTRARPRPIQWDSYRIPPGSTHAAVHRDGDVTWKLLGFARIDATLVRALPPAIAPALAAATQPSAPPLRNALPFAPIPPAALQAPTLTGKAITLTMTPFGPTTERALVPWLSASPGGALIVPYWPMAAPPLLYVLVLLRRRVRAALRRRRGQCERCGYDLRGAAHERCPECGARTALMGST